MKETYPVDARHAGKRGHYQTNTLNPGQVSGAMIAGNGDRVALLLSTTWTAPIIGDTVTVCVGAGVQQTAIVALSPGNPSVCLKLEDYGDAILQPLAIVSAAGSFTAMASAEVVWHNEGQGG